MATSAVSSSSSMTGPSSTSYESYAPRSETQRKRLNRIAALTAGPTSSLSLVPSKKGTKTTTTTAARVGNEDETGMESGQSTLLSAMSPPDIVSEVSDLKEGSTSSSMRKDDAVSRALEQAVGTADHLTMLIKHSTSLRLALRASINIAEDLKNRHEDLIRHSGELSAAAERLQAEEALLAHRAEEIGMPLKHYDAVDRIGILVGVLFRDGGRTVVRGLAKLKVDSADYEPTLDEIDRAVDFFGTESGGKDALDEALRAGARRKADEAALLQSGSIEYYRRSSTLQDAALFLIREAVVDRIAQTTKDVAAALNLPKVPIAADKLEASLVYTRFHGISSRSNRLISIVQSRLDRGDAYVDLFQLSRNTYCSSRETLLRHTIRAHMDKLRQRHGLVGMTRLASVFLIRLCTVETSLYLDFFGDRDKRPGKPNTSLVSLPADQKSNADDQNDKKHDDAATPKQRKSSSLAPHTTTTLASQVLAQDGTYRDTEFQNLLGALCSSLHRTVRRGLVSVHDLDTLCQIVSVLREERALANSSPTTASAATAISSVIVDAQERLIFCANSALQKEVVRFRPTPTHLDYPNRLLRIRDGTGTTPSSSSSSSSAAASATTAEASEGGASSKDASEDSTSAPPSDAAAMTKTEEANDAVKKQLLVYESWFPPMRSVLRVLSKIFRVVEPRVFEDLALQSVRECARSLKEGATHIRKKSGVLHADLFLVKHLLILREQLSPFDIQLRAVERQLDFSEAGKAVSRFLANQNRRLFSMSTENALLTLLREGVSVMESSVDSKRDLEDALRSACNDFIEHAATSSSGPILHFVEMAKNVAASSTGSNLRVAPFMSYDAVLGVLDRTSVQAESELTNIVQQMSLYLENPATVSILLKPVIKKITRAMDDTRKFLVQTADGENGWDVAKQSDVRTMIDDLERSVRNVTTMTTSSVLLTSM